MGPCAVLRDHGVPWGRAIAEPLDLAHSQRICYA